MVDEFGLHCRSVFKVSGFVTADVEVAGSRGVGCLTISLAKNIFALNALNKARVA